MFLLNNKHTLADLARLAYEAYGKQSGGLNYQGLPLPTYDAVGEKIQANWEASTQAILTAIGVPTLPLTDEQIKAAGIEWAPMPATWQWRSGLTNAQLYKEHEREVTVLGKSFNIKYTQADFMEEVAMRAYVLAGGTRDGLSNEEFRQLIRTQYTWVTGENAVLLMDLRVWQVPFEKYHVVALVPNGTQQA